MDTILLNFKDIAKQFGRFVAGSLIVAMSTFLSMVISFLTYHLCRCIQGKKLAWWETRALMTVIGAAGLAFWGFIFLSDANARREPNTPFYIAALEVPIATGIMSLIWLLGFAVVMGARSAWETVKKALNKGYQPIPSPGV